MRRGPPSTRPTHCALIKCNCFDPHNSTACYQTGWQAGRVPASPAESRTKQKRREGKNTPGINSSKNKFPIHITYVCCEEILIQTCSKKQKWWTSDEVTWPIWFQNSVVFLVYLFICMGKHLTSGMKPLWKCKKLEPGAVNHVTTRGLAEPNALFTTALTVGSEQSAWKKWKNLYRTPRRATWNFKKRRALGQLVELIVQTIRIKKP